MRFRYLPYSLKSKRFFLLVAAGATMLAGILFIFINPRNLGASDFLLIAWNPGQELLTKGSVYDGYPYPLWTVIVMLPLTIWSPEIGMQFWFLCNLVMLSASLVLLAFILEWRISPILLVFIVGLCGFYLPALTGMKLGQLTIFSLLILFLTLYAYKSNRWMELGVLIGLSFIKPQVMILLSGFLLLWALSRCLWRVWIGFGATIIFLSLISLPFIKTPSQLIGGGAGSHLVDYVRQTSTLWGVSLSLGFSWLVPFGISVILLGWIVYLWLPILLGRHNSFHSVVFLFSITTIVNLIVVPYSWMHNLILLILPIGYGATLAWKMNGRFRVFWLGALFTIMHPLMFGVFIFLGGPDGLQSYQIIPALILLPAIYYLESLSEKKRLSMKDIPYQDKPSPWSSHSRMAAKLKRLPKGSKVLDVGTATGTLARMCENNGLRFLGIEPESKWANVAMPYYERIWICQIEKAPTEALTGFDIVVLGDVLEHTTNPDAILKKLVEAQKPNAEFLISVPNVANLWVRLNLLLGRFDYAERGILDRTHVRFFTRKTLVAMAKNAGLEIVSIYPTPIPLELVSGFFTAPLGRELHVVLAWLTHLLPTLLGYQFILEARKS